MVIHVKKTNQEAGTIYEHEKNHPTKWFQAFQKKKKYRPYDSSSWNKIKEKISTLRELPKLLHKYQHGLKALGKCLGVYLV